MSFGDAIWFAYQAFATIAFTCACIYFAIRGAQAHLKQSKLGRDISQDDEALRELLRKQ